MNFTNMRKFKKYYESVDKNIKKAFRFSIVFILIKHGISIALQNMPLNFILTIKRIMADILRGLLLSIIDILESISFSFISAFIFYFIVNHMQEEKEKKKFTRIALEQLRKPVIRQVKLLTFMYKASFEGEINELPDSLEELFNKEYFTVIKKLNIVCQSPMRSEMTWKEYIERECKKFSESIEKTIMKYSYFLDEDLIIILENLNENVFMDIFLGRKNTFSYDDADGWREEESINHNTVTDGKNEYLFDVKLEDEKYILEDHVNYIMRFIEVHNNRGFEKKDNIRLKKELFHNGTGPRFGDSTSCMNEG